MYVCDERRSPGRPAVEGGLRSFGSSYHVSLRLLDVEESCVLWSRVSLVELCARDRVVRDRIIRVLYSCIHVKKIIQP